MKEYPLHMKISELSDRSGAPISTIRYYIREGLLLQPLKKGKRITYYTEDHLGNLLKIKKLKERKFKISKIKEIIAAVSDVSTRESEYDTGIRFTSTREAIVNSAVNLFLKNGYDDVKVSDVVSCSGTGKGTFYKHFPNKEELFFECIERTLHSIMKDTPQILQETDGLKRLWSRSIFYYKNLSVMIQMLNLARRVTVDNPSYTERLNAIKFDFIEPVRKDIEMAIKQKQIRLDDSTIAAYFFMGAFEYSYYYTLCHDIGIEELQEAVWKFFLLL